jgi:glyoxalase family protein
MKLEGIHHITAITADGPRNVDFYVRVLGLRLVKKTVNQDDPTAYHLFYADENGSHGADLTFFEYPGAGRGRAGAGMVHTIVHRIASPESLDFWEQRLAGEGVSAERVDRDRLRFSDPEGLTHELAVIDTPDEPLVARSTEVPAEFALQGFDTVRAYSPNPEASERLLGEALGFERVGDGVWEARGAERGGRIAYDRHAERGRPGGGTVHHVAWADKRADQDQWRRRAVEGGAHPTPVIDRHYFESIYFREPSGVLFELATADGNGMTVDEPLEHLGERLSLPPAYEHLRERVEPLLTPLPDIRQWRPAPAEAGS